MKDTEKRIKSLLARLFILNMIDRPSNEERHEKAQIQAELWRLKKVEPARGVLELPPVQDALDKIKEVFGGK